MPKRKMHETHEYNQNISISIQDIHVRFKDLPITDSNKTEFMQCIVKPSFIMVLSGQVGVGKNALAHFAAQYLNKKVNDASPTISNPSQDKKFYFSKISEQIMAHNIYDSIFIVDNIKSMCFTKEDSPIIEYPIFTGVFLIFIIDDGKYSHQSVEFMDAKFAGRLNYCSIKVEPTKTLRFEESIRNIINDNVNGSSLSKVCKSIALCSNYNFHRAIVGILESKCSIQSEYKNDKYSLLHIVAKFMYNKRMKDGSAQTLTYKEMISDPRPSLYFDIQQILFDNSLTSSLLCRYIYCNKHCFFNDIHEYTNYISDASFMEHSSNSSEILPSSDCNEYESLRELCSNVSIRSYLYNNNHLIAPNNKKAFQPLHYNESIYVGSDYYENDYPFAQSMSNRRAHQDYLQLLIGVLQESPKPANCNDDFEYELDD